MGMTLVDIIRRQHVETNTTYSMGSLFRILLFAAAEGFYQIGSTCVFAYIGITILSWKIALVIHTPKHELLE
jgi:hypothetical protein